MKDQSLKNRYPEARATLLLKGISFTTWCKENSISRHYAARVLKGERKGKKAQQLRNVLVREILED